MNRVRNGHFTPTQSMTNLVDKTSLSQANCGSISPQEINPNPLLVSLPGGPT